jgi:hypothetical protein
MFKASFNTIKQIVKYVPYLIDPPTSYQHWLHSLLPCVMEPLVFHGFSLCSHKFFPSLFPVFAFSAADRYQNYLTVWYQYGTGTRYRLNNTFFSINLPFIVPFGFHLIIAYSYAKSKKQVLRIQCTAVPEPVFLVPEANRFT